MTLMEVLITLLILCGGCLAAFAAFAGFGRAAARAELQTALTSIAQREIEKLRPVPFARLGLSSAPAAGVSPGSPASSQTVVLGGVVAPGPERVAYRGVTGRVYRFVTWQAQTCVAARTAIARELANRSGQSQAAAEAALGDLCPNHTQAKRLTVVVAPDAVRGRVRRPIVMSTVVADRDGLLKIVGTTPQALQVDPSQIVDGVQQDDTGPGSVYASVTSQTIELTDTPCGSSSRATPSSHDTRDTGRAGASCGTTGAPDLMTAAKSPLGESAAVRDFSKEITRPAAGGLALLRDDRDGTCAAELAYTSAEAPVRKRSLHAWATPPTTAQAETAPAAGRATVSLWTQTATGVDAVGRLCLVLRRYSTGAVIGSADYQLPSWPGEPTRLTVSFDLAHAVLPVGERLVLTARAPRSGGADLQIVYDHPSYESSLTLSMVQGKELR